MKEARHMTAQELLALADAMVEATHAYNAFLHDASAKMATRILSDTEMMPIRDSIQRHGDAISDATEAYRVARSSSPLTLEEQMLIDEFRKPDGVLLTATYEHARWLATLSR